MATSKSLAFLRSALLQDDDGAPTRIIGIGNDEKGNLQVYVANGSLIGDKLAIRHTITSEEVKIEDVPSTKRSENVTPWNLGAAERR